MACRHVHACDHWARPVVIYLARCACNSTKRLNCPLPGATSSRMIHLMDQKGHRQTFSGVCPPSPPMLTFTGATLSNPRQSWLYRQQYRSPTYARSAQAIAWTPAERSERARRRLALLYYLLRSPAFEGVTRPMLQRAQGVLSYVPLVGSITGKGLEIMEGIQQYYTYTAAS
mmetsp:Transcript_25288/g.63748  ORF Transcript_25288/g.63748 Transcript_25288/m.63748 type:complete len:172 (-) Transcript_25288:247-762(-)